jgi:hypothetical protein
MAAPADAAADDAAPAADAAPAMTDTEVARWLVQRLNRRETGCEHCVLAAAMHHDQWKHLAARVHELDPDGAPPLELVFSAAIDLDLERLQWFVDHFQLTADAICACGVCYVLEHAADALDFPKVKWLVDRFCLASRGDIREWVPRVVETVAAGGSATHGEMASFLAAHFIR